VKQKIEVSLTELLISFITMLFKVLMLWLLSTQKHFNKNQVLNTDWL